MFVEHREKLPVVVVSIGGRNASSTSNLDKMLISNAPPDNPLTKEINFKTDLGGEIIVSTRDSERVFKAIKSLSTPFKTALLIVGKSSGGVNAWNTFRLFYPQIAKLYKRCGLFMIDSHGRVSRDGMSKPYDNLQDLRWQPQWSENPDVFQIYNIYQQLHPAPFPKFEDISKIKTKMMETLTGARLVRAPIGMLTQVKLSDKQGLNHMNIINHLRTQQMIRLAFRFAMYGNNKSVVRFRRASG